MKLVLSNNTEIEVLETSTLFDIQVNPSQYQNMWSLLTPDNMTVLKMTTDDGDVMDQRENLIVESERSFEEKGSVQCHFYLREKMEVELLREEVKYLREMAGVHDEAIGDLGQAVAEMAEGGKQ